MIEINLLPPQYRSVERTPLPVFLGLVGALALIGGAFVTLMVEVKAAQHAEEQRVGLTKERDDKKKQAEQVDQLQRDIQEAQGRVDTVLNIAESKIPWAIKLDELMRILPEQTIWLDSLSFTQRPTGGEMKLQCNARGTGLDRFTNFKQALRSDTNFFYHFDSVDAPIIQVVRAGPQYFDQEFLQFTMTLPIRQVEIGGPRR
jgi:Tfp pilus assembly protein PilN